MRSEGWEEILSDEEVASLLRSAVRGAFGTSVEQDDARMDLELLDLAIDRYTRRQDVRVMLLINASNSEGKVIILVSYAGVEEDSFMAMDLTGVRRIYALARLSYQGEISKVESVKSVPYQSVSSHMFSRGATNLACRPLLLVLPCILGYNLFWEVPWSVFSLETPLLYVLEVRNAAMQSSPTGIVNVMTHLL